MMLGALVKRYAADLFGRDPSEIYLCSAMPCVRKKPESDRAVFQRDGVRLVDNVVTTRDLGDLLRLHEIEPRELAPLPFDSMFQLDEGGPDSLGTGAGQLFGATGGVMEAAVRSVYELLTGAQLPRLELEEVRGLDGLKEATIPLFSEETGQGLHMELKVAVVNGLGNAKNLIKAMRDGKAHYDFVGKPSVALFLCCKFSVADISHVHAVVSLLFIPEVMACPGGCIGGGGQPRSPDKDILQKRIQTIYNLDRTLPIRRSHENPTVQALYERHLGEIGGETAHDLLHVKQVYGGDVEETP
jgi:NADP-reducing hydrogenase subunit HndD